MTSELIVHLKHIDLRVVGSVGRKAATLGELTAAGFPIPEGVAVRTFALARTLALARLEAAASPAQVAGAPPPDDIAAALSKTDALIGPGPYAVRSSAVDEDQSDASFAGQYETVLGVAAQELTHAVRRCWSSAFTAHVRAYRTATGHTGPPSMAVLVQRMVQAEAAGVASLPTR